MPRIFITNKLTAKRLNIILFILLSVFSTPAQTSENPANPPVLKTGQKLEREIKDKKLDKYWLELRNGEFCQLEVVQNGIDVTVKVFNSNDQQIIERDAPSGAQGKEIITFIAPSRGLFRVEVMPTAEKAKAGNYSIELKARRPALANDLLRIKTEQAFFDAIILRNRQTPESIQAMQPKLEEAIAGWQSLKEKYWESMALEMLAGVYLRTGHNDKSLEMINLALQAARTTNDHFRITSVLLGFGDIYSDLKQSEKALDFYTQAADLAHLKLDIENEIGALQGLGSVYASEKQYAKSAEIYEKLLKLFQQQKDQAGEADTLNYIGVQYSNLADTKTAFKYFERSADIFRILKDAGGEALVLRNLGYDFYADGNSAKALEYYQRAYELRKNANLADLAIESLSEIVAIYKEQKNQTEFVKNSQELANLYEKAGNKKLEASTVNNIGLALGTMGEHQKALTHFTTALKLYRDLNEKENEATVLRNIALEYNHLGEFSKAIEYFKQTVDFYVFKAAKLSLKA